MTTHEGFEISAEWPNQAAAGEEDAANIAIRANGHVLTNVADTLRNETREYFRASAITFASWLAYRWWSLRYEPFPPTLIPSTEWRLRHELTAISGGLRWPPFMIYGVGDRVVIAPRAGISDVPGPLRYFNLLVESVDATLYESQLDKFFQLVSETCAHATDASVLVKLLDDLRHEREDPEVASWRRLEAELGFDIDSAPPNLMKQFAVLGDQLGEAAINEAAVSSPGDASASVLREALLAARESQIVIDRDAARGLPSAGQRPTAKMPPWQLAEKVAIEVRARAGAPHGPIRGKALGDILGATWGDLKGAPATAGKLPYAALANGKHRGERLAVQSVVNRGSAYRRFELARALADAWWDEHATFAPISGAKTDRQKFQRAFAQSFLCPFDDLMDFMNTEEAGEEAIARAARHFHVTDGVVRTVLVNKRVLPRERLEDALEAA